MSLCAVCCLLFLFVIILCSINILMLCSRRTVQAENTHIHTLWQQNYCTAHTHALSHGQNLRFIHTSAQTHTHILALPITFAHISMLALTIQLGIHTSLTSPLHHYTNFTFTQYHKDDCDCFTSYSLSCHFV